MVHKVYAIKKGIKTGIFNTWDECQKLVTGYKGAVYKSFTSLEEAEK
jgi:ribonuclease HI